MSALEAGHRLGQYRVIRLLGEGGMGAVYEARHESLDRRVAVKTLHAEVAANQTAVTRFFNEAKTLSRLEHPSIVQVSDFGTAPDGTAYLVMEYLRGDSLGKRLRAFEAKGERLPLGPALQICWQVADVLAMAHSQGIVHRDIKPENLMLVADSVAPSGERVKVLDFGIAKLTGDNERGVAKTDTNALMGTPMYMSPEQCSGAGRVDDKTDVYALGCVLFQALAGRPPFQAEGAGELIGMHLFQPPPLLSELAPKLPAAVVELVHRMLIKDKSLRPDMATTAHQLGRLLAQVTGNASALASQTQWRAESSTGAELARSAQATTISMSAGQSTASQRKRRSILIAGAVALVLMTVALGAYTRLRGPRAAVETSVSASVGGSGTTSVAVVGPDLKVPVVRWRIDTEPSGAFVVDNSGKVIGVTPWAHEQEAAEGLTVFRLKLGGFLETDVSFDGSTDGTQRIALKRKPSATGKPPAGNRGTQTEKKREIGYED